MHHEPANKLDRVATPLPLSLSCQVEPLKHSRSSPLHFHLSIQSSPHLTIQRSSSRHTSVPPPPACYTCTPIRAAGIVYDLPPLCHSSSSIHPSIHPSPITSSSTLPRSPPLHTSTWRKYLCALKACCVVQLSWKKQKKPVIYIFLKEYYSTYYDQSINAR